MDLMALQNSNHYAATMVIFAFSCRHSLNGRIYVEVLDVEATMLWQFMVSHFCSANGAVSVTIF